jgi:hypothetical protein
LRFQDLFDTALEEYSQKTETDLNFLKTDPLAARFLDSDCNSPDAVLKILEEQAQAFDQYRKGDWKVQLMRRLKPAVDILLKLSSSDVVVEHVSLVRLSSSNYFLRKVHYPPCRYFHQRRQYLQLLVSYSQYVTHSLAAWVCSLDTQTLKAAKGVSTSYDALVEFFECFERYLGGLKILTEIPRAVGEISVKIMVELLGVLALATQQIKGGRLSEFVFANPSHLA